MRDARTKIPKALQRSEHDEQRDLFAWAALDSRLASMFAIPNFSGHHGSKIARLVSGKRAKEEGRKSGVPDVFLPVSCGGYHGLFVEMKKANASPSDVTDEQCRWLNVLTRQGYRCEVARGFEEGRAAILAYLNLPAPSNEKIA